MKFEKKDLFTIPNILTYIRLIMVPFFVGVMVAYKITNQYLFLGLGFLLFVVAEITDIVDGFIARRFNMITDIGKIVDPIADKLLQGCALIVLGLISYYFFPFMIILIAKEIYMGLSSHYFMVKSDKRVEQKSNWVGKLGAVFNFITILIGFGVGAKEFFGMEIPNWIQISIVAINAVFMVPAIVFAIYAAVNYTRIYKKQLDKILLEDEKAKEVGKE